MKKDKKESNTDNFGVSELWLHYLWREEKLLFMELRAGTGERIKVLNPGWYNRGWGPDFKEARLLIGNNEYFGDIEIHVNESSWKTHRHHVDENYNRVILHLFLEKDKQDAKNSLGQKPHYLQLDKKRIDHLHPYQKETGLLPENQIPGACGLLLDREKHGIIKRMIFQLSEQRLIEKAKKFEAQITSIDPSEEEVLYQAICKSLGYSSYDHLFVQMAKQFPHQSLAPLFRKGYRQARVEVLGRWFGWLGYLDSFDFSTIHEELRREWAALKQFHQSQNENPPPTSNKPTAPSRPQNNPIRRLTALFHHLEKVSNQGILKSWLLSLQTITELINNEKKPIPKILNQLETMFPQPSWEPLNEHLTTTDKKQKSPVRMVGKHRLLIIMVNAILPFFLAWSRLHNDKTLEKQLFALFLILPNEGGNKKTKFMEQRLFKQQTDFQCRKNLSYHQGLIQLHDEFCKNFYEGCQSCSLLKLLKKENQPKM